MKWSKMMIQTLREDPGDAEIDSHKLLVRAALVKKTAAGLFTFLPLGMSRRKKCESFRNDDTCRGNAYAFTSLVFHFGHLTASSEIR